MIRRPGAALTTVAAVVLTATLSSASCSSDPPTSPPSAATSTSRGSSPTPPASTRATAAPTPTASSSASTTGALRVDSVDLRSGGRLPNADTRLPARIVYPPKASTSLLDDPPGRAVTQTMTWRPYDKVGPWQEWTTYFFGADGRWRSIRMGELGLPESRGTGADTGWEGTLSPDGRHWAFPTSKPGAFGLGPVGVMDLGTGEIDYYWPDQGRRISRNPRWIGTRLLAFDWKRKGSHVRAVVDVRTGQVRRSRPDFAAATANLVSLPDGTTSRLRRFDRPKPAVLETYGPGLRPRGRATLPFAVAGDEWQPFAVNESHIAIAAPSASLEGATGGPVIVVIDAETLQPEAILQGKGLQQRWSQMTWIGDDTLLLPSAVYVGGNGPQPVLAWNVDHGRISRISQLIGPRQRAHQLVGQIAASAVLE